MGLNYKHKFLCLDRKTGNLQILPIPFHCPLQTFREQYLRLIPEQPYSLAHAGHAVGYVTGTVGTMFRLDLCYLRVMRSKITAQEAMSSRSG